MKNFKGSISISRDNRNIVNIRVRDQASRCEFLDVEMTLEEYAFLITGLSERPIEGEIRGLDIGKVRENEIRSIEYPFKSYDKKAQEAWLIENCQESGWTLNSGLNSQQSVEHVDDKTFLNYTLTRYVEVVS